jgi:hypothetical protein
MTDKETTVWLLNLANDMRRHKNYPTLADLPESIPQDPTNCIIANAFNFGCRVMPDEGTITFQCQEDVDVYFKVMNLDRSNYLLVPDLDIQLSAKFCPLVLVALSHISCFKRIQIEIRI